MKDNKKSFKVKHIKENVKEISEALKDNKQMKDDMVDSYLNKHKYKILIFVSILWLIAFILVSKEFGVGIVLVGVLLGETLGEIFTGINNLKRKDDR